MTRAPIEPSSLELVTRPLAEARTLPGTAYASEAVSAWERTHFFDRAWVCAGRADEVGSPATSAR